MIALYIGQYGEQSLCEVLHIDEASGMAKISFEGDTGWCDAELVTILDENEIDGIKKELGYE